MASFEDSKLTDLESLFEMTRTDRFQPGKDAVPQEGPVGNGNIQPAGWIGDGAIDDIAAFASTIRPPIVVGELPMLPDASYPQGGLVFLTTDGKLYRNTDGSTWSVEVDGADIKANSVVAGSIAAGAIGTDQLAANAVRIGNMSRKGANLLDNPSFEEGTIPAIPGWTPSDANRVGSATSSAARTGTRVLRITGDGSAAFPSATSAKIPVRPGATYKLSAWMARFGGSNTGRTVLRTYDNTDTLVSSSAIVLEDSSSLNLMEDTYTIPTDGTVSFVRVLCFIQAATSAADDSHVWEDVELVEAADNVNNSSGDVTIDADGITIRNGKLTLEDKFSQSVLGPAGFEGAFRLLERYGFYNADFAAGDTGNLTVTETGGADTASEYEDSLGDGLPYWVVSAVTGTPGVISDSSAAGGKAVEIAGSETLTIYQDIPVSSGRKYQVFLNWSRSTAVQVAITISWSWRTATHALIGSSQDAALLYTGSQAYFDQSFGGRTDAAPANAAYQRVTLNIVVSSGTQSVRLNTVNLKDLGAGRFVPMRAVVVNGATTTSNVALGATSSVVGVPTNATAIQVEVRCSSTTPAAGNWVGIYHGTDSSLNAGVCFNSALANLRNVFSAIVSYSPGAGFYYQVNRSAGTVGYDLIVTGYFADE